MSKKSAILAKKILLPTLLFSIGVQPIGFAETSLPDSSLIQFPMETMIVTANRYTKPEVDVAASTTILTRQDLEQTGTSNVMSALSQELGLTYIGYGPEGSSLGSKNSTLTIRGVDKGTLVLLNGMPLNLNGRYNLEDLPFDAIDKVEIVRGGGSVLYGSEAIGGVINIITSDNLPNKAWINLGDRDRQQLGVSYQASKLSIAASRKHWGGHTKTSELLTENGKKDLQMNNYLNDMYKHNVYLDYKFDNNSNILLQHTESEKDYEYRFGEGYETKPYYDQVRYTRDYRYKKNMIQYGYNENGLNFRTYYNDSKTYTKSNDFYSSKGSTKGYPTESYQKDKEYSAGFDLNNRWSGKTTDTIVGISYQHEYYNPNRLSSTTYDKNNYSIYSQIEKKLDSKNNVLINGRQSWADMHEKTFTNFSGEIQYIYTLADENNLYLKAGQSFRMPYLREMYSSGENRLIGNTDLKPEKGMHYELGWKKNVDNDEYRVAIFKENIKDNITYTLNRRTGKSYSTNEDFKNTGIEASWKHKNQNGLHYGLGIAFGNPKTKTCKENAPASVTVKDYWDRKYGRMQFNGNIGYSHGKWNSNLIANYMYERVASPSSMQSFKIKPYLLTSLYVKYKADNENNFTLRMENLFNREDNFGWSTTGYSSTPRTILAGYELNF